MMALESICNKDYNIHGLIYDMLWYTPMLPRSNGDGPFFELQLHTHTCEYVCMGRCDEGAVVPFQVVLIYIVVL